MATSEDQYMKHTRELVAKNGHAIQWVQADPERKIGPFAYTIGCTARFGFEYFVSGLGHKYAALFLNHIVEAVPHTLENGFTEPYKHKDWACPMMLKRATLPLGRFASVARRFYGKEPTFVQLVLPDASGVFPGEPGFDHEYMDERQSLLYTPTQP